MSTFLYNYKTTSGGSAMTFDFSTISTIPENFTRRTVFVFVVNMPFTIHKVCCASCTFAKMCLLFTFQQGVTWQICKQIQSYHKSNCRNVTRGYIFQKCTRNSKSFGQCMACLLQNSNKCLNSQMEENGMNIKSAKSEHITKLTSDWH